MSATPIATPISENRVMVALASLIIGLLLLIVMHLLLPEFAAVLLLDRAGLTYPLSIQNIMWLVFCCGFGELVVRRAATLVEESQLRQDFLPEDATTMLQRDDLGKIYERVSQSADANRCFLPRMIQRCLLQFESTLSIEQSSAILTTNLDIYLHEIDLRYTMLRYVMWLIPSLGFIGTVIGISTALAYAGEPGRIDDPGLLTEVTRRLAVAFYTTLLALVMAAILVFGSGVVQTREEKSLNRAGQYCLDNLINRLFVR